MRAVQYSRCSSNRSILGVKGACHRVRRRLNNVGVVCGVKDVFMPALSSTMTEGKIVTWLKQPGDKVSKGESIVVVESDKADMDVESFSDGIMGAIVIPEGGVANVGEPIAFVAESENDLAEAQSKAEKAGGAAADAPAPAVAPKEAESEKVEVKAAAPEPVVVAAAPAPTPVATPPPPAAPTKRSDGRIIATPYAKKLAKTLKVDLAQVIGTGPNGRITAADVERLGNGAPTPTPTIPSPTAVTSAAPTPTPAPAAAAKPEVAGTTVSELRGTTTPFTSLEKAVSKNMCDSLTIPEFRCQMSICTDKLDALYQELKPKGVSMSVLLTKACGIALSYHPRLFSSCTPDGAGITYNEHVNIANAVAMPDGGLITPVLKDADATDVYELSRQWKDLVKRARSKQLKPDEFTSGTFTISNLGMFGVDTFDAILPVGTAAILAVGASQKTVIATDDGMFGVKKMMQVNITCDHRVVYGAHAAEFLQTLKTTIENPEVLLK